jgi:four helix bundle protein
MKNGTARTEPQRITDRSFDFAVRVVKLCEFLDGKRGVAKVLMPQILRAGTSVVSNVEEAQGGQSKADFISKMSIALKEARESHVRLRILAVTSAIDEVKLTPLIQEADELKRIIGAIIVSAKKRGGG